MDFLAFPLSLFFGFAPMFLFAYIIYWLDRYEKEPAILLGGVFIWGAVVAAGAAFLINTLLGAGVYLVTGSEFATELSTGSLFAPVVEESLKGFAVLVVFIVFRKEFDSILDGIVYAAITALGFAATENAYYIFTYGYLEDGFAGLFWLVIVRVFLVGWQHAFYTAFIGIGLAIARLSRHILVKVAAPILGWMLAVIAHAAHNTIAVLLASTAGLAIGTLLDWSGWTMMFFFILWALYREQRWIIQQLHEEVGLGIITPGQYRIACSAWAVSFTRLKALFSGQYLSTHRFYQTCSELAYKKHQRVNLGEESDSAATIQRLRADLARLAPKTHGSGH